MRTYVYIIYCTYGLGRYFTSNEICKCPRYTCLYVANSAGYVLKTK